MHPDEHADCFLSNIEFLWHLQWHRLPNSLPAAHGMGLHSDLIDDNHARLFTSDVEPLGHDESESSAITRMANPSATPAARKTRIKTAGIRFNLVTFALRAGFLFNPVTGF